MTTAKMPMMSGQLALDTEEPMSVEAIMPGRRPTVESTRKLVMLMGVSGTM